MRRIYIKGYRHKTVIRFLHATHEPSFKQKISRLDRIRRKRHQAVYRLAGAISEREARETIEFAEDFVIQVMNLI